MSTELEKRSHALLLELGLLQADEPIEVAPLAGGVASDIARVTAGERIYCVKFALPKLKVEADWYAPVHRNAAEYAWLKVAAAVAPEAAVTLYGASPEQYGFVMEFLQGEDIYLWKSALLNELPDNGEAGRVGDVLGRIHQRSSTPEFDRSGFDNQDDFHALRLEPYLLHTASKHPDIRVELGQLAEQLYLSRQVLVHGDVSPKNILFRGVSPILLDAECATMGDASFDPAFCLNHLVLKAIHLPASRLRYLDSVLVFWQAYAPLVNWESAAQVESRICRLLPALMLARVDGKSPVDYLDARQRRVVRDIARHFIIKPVAKLDTLVQGIEQQLGEVAEWLK